MAKVLKMCLVLFITVLILTVTIPTYGASVYKKRSTSSSTTTTSTTTTDTLKSDCQSQPCGWAVYTPFSRTINYFMKNTCECPGIKICIRNEDDISISAFVYRCREPKQNREEENVSS